MLGRRADIDFSMEANMKKMKEQTYNMLLAGKDALIYCQ